MKNESLTLRHRIGLEIARKLNNDLLKEHPLKQLFWECTLRCNLHCRHCGSDCKKMAGHPDMPKEDFLKVLDSVAASTDPHKVFVIITGGEPLMREDLEECGKAIYDKGFPWGMVTNGLYMTRERFRRLLASGLHTATVSLDGFAADHNWMRGNPQSFERAVEVIKMMAEEPGFVFDVVTCVNKHSYMRLEEMKEFLLSLGVKRWRLFTVFPVGRAAKDPELQLSNRDFRGVMEFIKRTRKEGRIKTAYGCEGFLGNYEGDVRDHFFHCQAGVSVGSVLVDGAILLVPASVPTIIKAIFIRMTLWRCGITNISLIVTASGCAKGSVPTVSFSVIAKETACICVTGREICCFAIIRGCKHYKTRKYEHEKENRGA